MICVSWQFCCQNVEDMSRLTGKTTGIPPRTALDPSSAALLLKNKPSAPSPVFHDRTVAPCKSTSTRSPAGSVAITRELSSDRLTSGVGALGVMGILVGRGLSGIVAVAEREYWLQERRVRAT